MMGRAAAAATAALCCLTLLAAPAWGDILENRLAVYDFTQPDEIKTLVSWNDKAITANRDGLGFDGKANQSRDVSLEFKKPLAVGWSWQPATTVMLRVQIDPPGEFRFGPNSITYPSTAGVMYARYSPDGKNWSTWQALSLREPRRKANPRLVFHGQLRVPAKSREAYREFLKRHSNMSRYLGNIDEEAAVRALLKEQPKFFEKNMPFIGYVDFLWETQIRGHQRLRKITVEMNYGRGGRAPTPAGHRENEPWRFRASE